MIRDTITRLRAERGRIEREYFYDDVTAEQQAALVRAVQHIDAAITLLTSVHRDWSRSMPNPRKR